MVKRYVKISFDGTVVVVATLLIVLIRFLIHSVSIGKIDVHNPNKLEMQVLHKYFRHSKFASFQRQLNYFGFRKLAGKGKMAPCSYVNDAASGDIGSLLLIKVRSMP
jgi:hypothetical protein